jgi:hypothetical protein
MVPGAVPEEGEEDEYRVLAPGSKPVPHPLRSFSSHDELFLLHLGESSRENPRAEPGIVSDELAKSAQLQERHVPEQEQGPASSESPNAFPEWVGLVREQWEYGPPPGLSGPPLSSHYPSRPYRRYILSKG